MPLNIDFQQILLHLLNFIILAGGLYLLLYNPVKKFMEKREAELIAKNKEAEEKLLTAESLKKEYEEKMSAAEAEISLKKSKAAKEAAEIGEHEIEKARAQAENIIISARKEALNEKDKILTEAQTEISDIAAAATEKLLKQSTAEVFDKFLDIAEAEAENE